MHKIASGAVIKKPHQDLVSQVGSYMCFFYVSFFIFVFLRFLNMESIVKYGYCFHGICCFKEAPKAPKEALKAPKSEAGYT